GVVALLFEPGAEGARRDVDTRDGSVGDVGGGDTPRRNRERRATQAQAAARPVGGVVVRLTSHRAVGANGADRVAGGTCPSYPRLPPRWTRPTQGVGVARLGGIARLVGGDGVGDGGDGAPWAEDLAADLDFEPQR